MYCTELYLTECIVLHVLYCILYLMLCLSGKTGYVLHVAEDDDQLPETNFGLNTNLSRVYPD